MRRPRSLADYVVAVAAVAVGLSVGVPIYVAEHVSEERRASSCADRDNLWDGEVTVVRLIGKELGATEARIDVAVGHLKDTIGDRPRC